MPKNQIIDPNKSRKKRNNFSPIPVNQYSPNIKTVKGTGNKRIIKIYKDMFLFANLNNVKSD